MRSPLRNSIIFLPLLLLLPPLFLNHHIPRHDTLDMLLWSHRLFSGLIGDGELPLWSPYINWGTPTNFYLPRLPALLLFWPVLKVFPSLNVVSVFYAAILLCEIIFLMGCFGLARQLFKSWEASVIVTVGLGATIYWTYQPYFNLTPVYFLPLALSLLFRGFQRGEARALAFSALVMGAGLPGAGYYGLIPLALYLLFLGTLAWSFRQRWSGIRASAGRMEIWIVVIGGTCLLQHLGFLLSIGGSAFSGPARSLDGTVDYHTFLSYHVDDTIVAFSGWLNGAIPFYDASAYAGLLTPPFLLVAALTPSRREALPFLLGSVVLFLFWMAGSSFVAPLSYYLPGVSFFRHLNRTTGILRFLLAFAAGFGIDAFVVAVRSGNFRGLRRYAGILLPTLILMGAVSLGTAPFPMPNLQIIPLATYLLLVVVSFLLLLRIRFATVKYLPMAFLGIALIDVTSFRARMIHTLFPLPEARWQEFRPVAHVPREQRVTDYLASERFNQWFPYLFGEEANRIEFQRCRAGLIAGENCERYGLSRGPLLSLYSSFDEFLGVDPCQTVFRFDAYSASTLTLWHRLGLKGMAVGGAPLGTSARLAPYCDRNKWWVLAGEREVPARVVLEKLTSNRVELTVEGTAGGEWLHYADAWHPAWTAKVNGQEVPVLVSQEAFKAVALPVGKVNSVTFEFDVPFLYASFVLIALSGALFVLGALWWGLREMGFTFGLPKPRWAESNG